MTKDCEFEPNKEYFLNFIYENLIKEPKRIILFDNEIIYRSEDISDYNFFDYYKQYCSNSFFYDLDVPHMILNFTGSIENLEKLKYQEETVKYLNDKGLHIFLIEQLQFSKNREKIYISPNQSFDENKLYLDLETYNDSIDVLELESISEFVTNNNLKNVIVYTIEDNIETLKTKYSNFKIHNINIHTATYSHFKNYKLKNFNEDLIEKKFCCLNKRYEAHRYFLASYLLSKESSYVSFLSLPKKKPLTLLLNSAKKLNFHKVESKQELTTIFNKCLIGDKILTSSNILKSNINDNLNCLRPPLESILKSFCFVVTETSFTHPFPMFTEKTLTPIECLRPFLLVSPSRSLASLKKLGFKTFDRWWDESYDDEVNTAERLLKIIQTIDYIDRHSIEQLRLMYLDMKNVLQYNLDHLKTIQGKEFYKTRLYE